jgi:hypothetical protein
VIERLGKPAYFLKIDQGRVHVTVECETLTAHE